MSDKLKFLFDHDILLNPKRIGPYSVEIDPTNRCPIGCHYCVWSEMRARNDVSLREDVFSRLIDDLIELCVAGIVFTGGGEPLSHPFTRKAITRAKAGGVSVGLFTSGVPLHKKVCAEILPSLSWIRFNVAAPTRNSYKQIQGADVFEHVVQNITNCVNTRNEGRLNVKLGIGCVLSRRASDPATIPALVALATTLRLDFIQFKHDLNEIGQPQYELWWQSQVLPELRSIKQAPNTHLKVDYSDNTYTFTPKASCFIARKMAAIKADGSVVVCKLHRDNAAMAVGNINDETFQSIWLNARRQKIVETLEQEGCNSCCGYKDFNRHVMITRETAGARVGHITSYAVGLERFAEDINFI